MEEAKFCVGQKVLFTDANGTSHPNYTVASSPFIFQGERCYYIKTSAGKNKQPKITTALESQLK